MSFDNLVRTGLAVVAAAALAACTGGGGGGSGGDGTGGHTSSGGDGGPGSDSGSGGAASSQVHTDVGACGASSASSPLDHKVIFSQSFSYYGPITQTVVLGSNGLWSGTITDQADYQPFQDSGLPAVDFTTNVVMISAATNGCGGSALPSNVGVTSVGGAPHLDLTYTLLGEAPFGSPTAMCLCESISDYAMTAVTVAKPSAAPTICMHTITGC